MTIRILIMGLPGAGKTTLAQELKSKLESHNKTVEWFNADKIRQQFNDWDFSYEGRIRQATRMKELADTVHSDYVICDFVAPLTEMRDIFDANCTIWVDTVVTSQYFDTNKIFAQPTTYDFRITEKSASQWADKISKNLV